MNYLDLPCTINYQQEVKVFKNNSFTENGASGQTARSSTSPTNELYYTPDYTDFYNMEQTNTNYEIIRPSDNVVMERDVSINKSNVKDLTDYRSNDIIRPSDNVVMKRDVLINSKDFKKILHVQSIWHLQQYKYIEDLEVIVLGFGFSYESLIPHLIRLNVECLPDTNILCRNPEILTINNLTRLKQLDYLSVNSFVRLEIGRNKIINKQLKRLQLTHFDNNYYAKINRMKNIDKSDFNVIKASLSTIAPKYSITDLCNTTTLHILRAHGRMDLFEPLHTCLTCLRLVTQDHKDSRCKRGRTTEKRKCSSHLYTGGNQQVSCIRIKHTNHVAIHRGMITQAFYYNKLPRNDLFLIERSLTWQSLKNTCNMSGYFNIVKINKYFKPEEKPYAIKSLLPDKLESNQIVLARECNCPIKSDKSIICSCSYFLVSNFLCFLRQESTQAALLITVPVATNIIKSNINKDMILCQKNHIIFYIFTDTKDKMCFENSIKYLDNLSANLISIKITLIIITCCDTNIEDMSKLYNVPCSIFC